MISVVLQSAGKTHTIIPPCVIGRGNEADLSFPDPAISHRHALIEERDSGVWIQDLGSANGVFVNDILIQGKAPLKTGDSIRLGQTELMVLLQEAEKDISERTVILHSFRPETEWNLDQKRLRLIYEIAAELSENQDVSVLGEKLFSQFKEIFNQDRGYIALFQKDGSLKPLLMDSATKSVPVSRSIVNRMFRDGESFLLEDALSEDAFKEQESILALRIRSALCVPLIFHDQIYGLMYLDRNIPGAYKKDDLEFLRSIAFILAPLIENARLWSELKKHFDNAMETLRETQVRLIDMERQAAYVRLAHAMAHEIRNPLMVVGGLLRRMARSESGDIKDDKMQAVMSSIERIEMVLREVDTFVKIPAPRKKLEKADQLVRDAIELHKLECDTKCISVHIRNDTSQLMVPLDAGLFRKALSMIFREVMFSIPQGTEIGITIRDYGNDLEIVFGTVDNAISLCEMYSPELQDKPWSLSLFLNIAHKIISDHGGKLLLTTAPHLALPVLVRIPRTVRI